jgi:FixJ family two-component response regulator
LIERKFIVGIVDDDSSVRKALTRLMRSAGLDVATFASGAEFLEFVQTGEPDCVVLDLHMPGINGFDVLAELAAAGSPLPVIVITGHDSEDAHARAMAANPAAYLTKPVNDQTLLDVISTAIADAKLKSSPLS